MTDATPDAGSLELLEQLAPFQREALQQYTQVTNQDVKDAIPLLQRSQWNVQIAVSKFFDGEGPDPLEDAIAEQQAIPRASPRNENLQESFLAADARGPSNRHGRDPNRPTLAPRVVPQKPQVNQPGLLLGLLLTPVTLGLRLASALYRTVLYVLAFLPRAIRPRAVTAAVATGFRSTNGRRMLLPPDTAMRFRREFDEEYGGDHGLPWFEGGFAQAYDQAKRDLGFLLMVLVSPEHDDTGSFVRETLLSPEVVSFLNDRSNNIVLWGGNVLDSEAFQAAQDYGCTKFPFSALICLTPREGSGGGSATRMGVVKRLAGPMQPAAYIAELQSAITKYAPDLVSIRAERTAAEVARNLRTEQDSAYERSLARDRERARLRREEAAAAAEAERKAKAAALAAAALEEKRRQWKAWRAGTIAPEPQATVDAKDVVRIALKMPESSPGHGQRIVRRFLSSTTMEELYAFVECYDVSGQETTSEGAETPAQPEDYQHQYRFQVASLMPRVVYEPSGTVTMGERIGRSGNLIVEEVGLDGEEEELDEKAS